MTDAPELKPCPFCSDLMEDRGYGAVHVVPGKCPIGDLAVDVARWNRRSDLCASGQQVRATLRDLKDAAKEAGLDERLNGIRDAEDAVLAALTPAPEAAQKHYAKNAYCSEHQSDMGDGRILTSETPIPEPMRAPEAAQTEAVGRATFPILGSEGARIDYQLVADHGGQAKSNHHQSVERLAQRGGLSWAELHAVLNNLPFVKMDTNAAMLGCRKLEVNYLAAVAHPPAAQDSVREAAQEAMLAALNLPEDAQGKRRVLQAIAKVRALTGKGGA